MRAPVFSGLRARLLLLALVAFLPVVGVTLYSGARARQHARQATQDGALHLAQMAAHTQERLVDAARDRLTLLAKLPEVAERDAAACGTLFRRLLMEFEGYSNPGVADATGKVFCGAVEPTQALNVAGEPWFQRAVRTRSFVVADDSLLHPARPQVTVAWPVLDESRQVQMVMFADLDLIWLSGFVAKGELPPGSTVRIIGRDGTTLLRYPELERSIGQAGARVPIVSTVLARHEGVAEALGIDGTPRLFAFTQLVAGDRPYGYLIIGIPKVTAFMEVQRALKRDLGLLGLAALVVLIATWTLSDRFLLRPVGALAQAARRLATGDLSARSSLGAGSTEIHRLSRAFDGMAESLQQTIARLQDAEARYRGLFEQLPDGVLVIDPDTTLPVEFNEAAHRQLGYSREEFARLRVSDYEAVEAPDDTRAHIDRIQRDGRDDFETMHRTKGGELRNVMVTVQQHKLAGRLVLVAIFRDITARRQAEAEIERRNRELSVLFAIDQAASQSLDLEQVLRMSLDAVKEALGLKASGIYLLESDGLTLRLRAHSGLSNDSAENFRVLKVGEGVSGQAAAERRPVVLDISEYPTPRLVPLVVAEGVRTIAAVPLLSGGELVGTLILGFSEPRSFPAEELALLTSIGQQLGGVVRNAQLHQKVQEELAERKRAEEALRQSQEQFYQAQKMEAVGRLASGVAHDFNNLLTAILGYSNLVLDELAEDDPRRGDVLEIQKAAERAAGLTRQLLAFSRKQPQQLQTLNLNDVITATASMLGRLLGEDIALRTDSAPDLWPVQADVSQMEQIVMNLAVNARDAMSRGGALTIETANVKLDERFVRAHAGSHAGPHVMVAVTDTGMGMDEATMARIFEPFFTTKEPGKGTGLGLSTVFGIVKQSDGYIDVSSQPGAGTTFRIYLPRVDAAAEAVSVGPAVREAARGGETILLVEDELGVRTLLRRTLERLGYVALEAANGREALDVAARHDGPIDLVVSDVVMPEMGGPELMTRLAQTRPAARLLLASACADSSYLVATRKVPLLQKPFTLETVARKVREVLDSAGTATARDLANDTTRRD